MSTLHNDKPMPPNKPPKPKPKPPKIPAVLRGAYTKVVSLERAVRDLCVLGGLEVPVLRCPLETDSDVYSDFLRRACMAVKDRSPKLPKDTTTNCECDMDDVISRALSRHFRTQPSPSNVLCNGARRRDGKRNSSTPFLGANNGHSTATGGANNGTKNVGPTFLVVNDVDIVHASQQLTVLRDPQTWGVFNSRAGDAITLHLLTHASVFMPASCAQIGGFKIATQSKNNRHTHGGYLQLCGAPVSFAAQGRMAQAAKAAKQVGRGGRGRVVSLGIPDTSGGRGGRGETRGGRGGRGETGGRGRGNGNGNGRPQTRDKNPDCERREPDETTPNETQTTPATTPPGSAAAKMLQRASGFVLGVMTANPFMRVRRARAGVGDPVDAETTTPNADESGVPGMNGTPNERNAFDDGLPDVGIVSESIGAVTEGGGSARGAPVPVCATFGTGTAARATVGKPPRQSSWRRRAAAKARSLETPGDGVPHTGEPSTDCIPETPNASQTDGQDVVVSQTLGRARLTAAFHGADSRPTGEETTHEDGNPQAGGDSDSDSRAGWERLGLAADAECVDLPVGTLVDGMAHDNANTTHGQSNARRIALEASLRAEARRARLASSRVAAAGEKVKYLYFPNPKTV